MEAMMAAVIEHGYIVLFVLVLADQAGLPMPTLPLLVAAGGLAGKSYIDPFLAVLVATLAALLADWLWYELGKKHGVRIVRVLCKIALEADSCVRNTQALFARHGARSLLVAKWVPGLQTVAPPLAGAAGLARGPFLLYAGAGALLWSGSLIGAGYLLRDQIGAIAARFQDLGFIAVLILGGGLLLYIVYKAIQRHRFVRSLRGARISPGELGEIIARNEQIEVLDLRHPIDFATDPNMIPGARRVSPEDLDRHHEEIPRDRDIILYCT